jgi:hypothetical protein
VKLRHDAAAVEDEDPDVRTLSHLARMPMAVWLGIVGIGVQAALPLFLAFAIASADRVAIAETTLSAIHPEHGDQAPSHRHTPLAPNPEHLNCVLAQGHHAASPVALPAVLVLLSPGELVGTHATAGTPALYRRGSPASYASRAPPQAV